MMSSSDCDSSLGSELGSYNVVIDRRLSVKGASGRIVRGTVKATTGALVRERKELSSFAVCRLLSGTQVLCGGKCKVKGVRRRKILAPCFGWVSESALDLGKRGYRLERWPPGLTEAIVDLTKALRDKEHQVLKELEEDDDKPKKVPPRQKNPPRQKKQQPPRPVSPMRLDERSFDAEVLRGDCFVSFTASWCTYSRGLEPIWTEVATRLHDVTIATIDVAAAPIIASRFGIRGLPTLLFFHRGSVFEYSGPRTLDSIIAFATGGFRLVSTAFPFPPRMVHTY